jgi:hypothetical protein
MGKKKIDPATGLPRVKINLALPSRHVKAIKEIAQKRSCPFDVVFQEIVGDYVKHMGYPETSRCYGPDLSMNDLYAEAVEFYLEHRKQIQ